MAKKIFILEDKPEKLGSVISKIQTWNEVERVEVLYYVPDISDSEAKVEELKNTLHTEVTAINLFIFDRVLDGLYKDPDNLFIFDTSISDESIEVFSYRVNVSYALRKKEQLQDENLRIWFYTVAGLYYESNIKELFEDYTLRAEMKEKDNLKLFFNENEKFREALQQEAAQPEVAIR